MITIKDQWDLFLKHLVDPCADAETVEKIRILFYCAMIRMYEMVDKLPKDKESLHHQIRIWDGEIAEFKGEVSKVLENEN